MICADCGGTFVPKHKRHKYCCHTTDNSTRTRARAILPSRFVGVDGEGVTRPDGTHRYVLLSVGTESLHNDGRHLEWWECFRFLYNHHTRNPGSVYVGFYLGYDFTQILRTLPGTVGVELLTITGQAARQRRSSGGNTIPFPVSVMDPTGTLWKFDLLANKRLKLRPAGRDTKWMYVCDVGGFFQSSFLTAINPTSWDEPIASPEEYALIVEGKRLRATATLNESMIRYNITENVVLARLMTRVEHGLQAVGLQLNANQWFGPGQVASAWLKSITAPTSAEVNETVPQYARTAGQAAYYGGWFEIMAHGHIPGKVYEYDINSAYPHVISTLPCLLHGEWMRGTHEYAYDPRIWRMVRVTVEGSNNRTGPAPHRTPRGRILRPLNTSGWHWEHELRSARAAGLIDRTTVHEWVSYQPCPCPPPLAAISGLYQERLRVGKNSPQGRALKLIYNSSYGKMAQTVGNPRYANSIYASLITAGCRTAILRAIATHPTRADSLIMVATDGVYFREPHTRLELDPKRLGAWDHTVKHGMTLVMPGIYWDDTTRELLADGRAAKLKSRGISAADLGDSVAELDEKWTNFRPPGEWPTLHIPVRFAMTSAKQAAVRGKWETAGTLTLDGSRILNSDPALKRRMVRYAGGLIRSAPHLIPYDGPIESTPYDKTFGADDHGRDDVPITLDAEDVDQAWGWALM